VPAPAGAILALSPFFVAFAFDAAIGSQPYIYAASFVISGSLMISRVPTYLIGKLRVPRRFMRLFLFAVVLFIAGLLSATWYTLLVGTVLYILSIPLSIMTFRKKKKIEG